jgi:hypothetical protein
MYLVDVGILPEKYQELRQKSQEERSDAGQRVFPSFVKHPEVNKKYQTVAMVCRETVVPARGTDHFSTQSPMDADAGKLSGLKTYMGVPFPSQKGLSPILMTCRKEPSRQRLAQTVQNMSELAAPRQTSTVLWIWR